MTPPARGEPGARRASRERALGLLYEAESRGVDVDQVLADQPTEPDAYAEELVRGVGAHADEIDRLIADHATGWSLDRMPAVDRAVARLATYELAHRPDVPTGVALAEAVELASSYSTEDSSRFLNGLLAGVGRSVRP